MNTKNAKNVKLDSTYSFIFQFCFLAVWKVVSLYRRNSKKQYQKAIQNSYM